MMALQLCRRICNTDNLEGRSKEIRRFQISSILGRVIDLRSVIDVLTLRFGSSILYAALPILGTFYSVPMIVFSSHGYTLVVSMSFHGKWSCPAIVYGDEMWWPATE